MSLGQEAQSEWRLDILSAGETETRISQLSEKLRMGLEPLASNAATSLAVRLLEAAHVEREIEDDRPELALPAGVLSRGRGSCLGLSGLYLVVAERLGIEAHLALAPGHAFIRAQQQGRTVNVELLRRGEIMPDAWYVEKYAPPVGNSTYMRSLTLGEALAVFRYNLASAAVDLGQPDIGLKRYREVLSILPDFAEAHAAAGFVHQKQQRPEQAIESYREALRANPGIRGVAANLEQLER